MKMAEHKKFLFVFIAAHFIFIVVQIFNYTQYISYSYTKQKNEKKVQQLLSQKEELHQQLYALKDLRTIKEWAITEQQMAPLTLRQVKKL